MVRHASTLTNEEKQLKRKTRDSWVSNAVCCGGAHFSRGVQATCEVDRWLRGAVHVWRRVAEHLQRGAQSA